MSKISHSVYQKLKEENKRLLCDIRLLVDDPDSMEGFNCFLKWKDHFEKERRFNSMMKEACEEYVKEHKDELPDFLVKLSNKPAVGKHKNNLMEAQVKIDFPILNVDFFRNHEACYDPAVALGEDWTGNILDLMKMKNIKSEDRIWAFTRKGSAPESIQRLAAISIVRLTPISEGRKVIDLIEDKRSINALSVAERHANGEASDEELDAARAAACAAASTASRVAAWDASRAAASAAARAAARAVARDAAWDAASAAARNAAWHAASVAAWDAAGDAVSAAAGDAVSAAARDAASAAAWDAARDAASVAASATAWDAQVDIIIDLLESI